MKNRITVDDFLKEKEEHKIIQDGGGRPRIIKKKPVEPLPEMYRNETELKKAAANLLKSLQQCLFLPTDNMALMVGNGKKVKTRTPGLSDHHLCIRGLFVAIEAKMQGKDLDPDQIKYRDKVLQAKGIFILYHSLHELVEELKKHRLVTRKFTIN